MPRKPKVNTKQQRGINKLSQVYLESIAEEIIAECEKLLPPSSTSLSDEIEITASPSDVSIKFSETFDPILLPSKFAGESVYQVKGTNPNTQIPYGYAAMTKEHTRKTSGGNVRVRAHNKHYKVGYKPVKGTKSGRWYTASSKNNFGLRMAELRIERNFVQTAYDKVYRKLPKAYRQQLPKVIEIQE
tara:strand:+ start:75 stop:635 length:561 start_codon:yes stop_codon:yes gene_type:complete